MSHTIESLEPRTFLSSFAPSSLAGLRIDSVYSSDNAVELDFGPNGNLAYRQFAPIEGLSGNPVKSTYTYAKTGANTATLNVPYPIASIPLKMTFTSRDSGIIDKDSFVILDGTPASAPPSLSGNSYVCSVSNGTDAQDLILPLGAFNLKISGGGYSLSGWHKIENNPDPGIPNSSGRVTYVPNAFLAALSLTDRRLGSNVTGQMYFLDSSSGFFEVRDSNSPLYMVGTFAPTKSRISNAPPTISSLNAMFSGPPTLKPGKAITVFATVSEGGAASVSGTIKVTLYATPQPRELSPVQLAKVIRHATMRQGKTTVIRQHFRVPNLATGSYAIVAAVEFDGMSISSSYLANVS